MNVVELKGVSKTFFSNKKQVIALDKVSLEITDGEVFGLLGPNGAGKTTLISILSGLTSFDSGSVRVFGLDVNDENREEILKKINIVRGFSGAYTSLTVLESLEYYMHLYDCYDLLRAKSCLAAVGLSGLESTYPSDLSSGLRQRFFFAKALSTNPKLLLLDEPTVGLDIEAAVKARQIIAGQSKLNRTVLLTTHYLLEAEELCDRIALISHGKIVALGTPGELKDLVKEKEMVRVSCLNVSIALKEARQIKGVFNVTKIHNGLEIEVENAETISRILRVLSEKRFGVKSIEVVEPPLEEAFLKLAGN